MSTTILTDEQIETLFREHDDLYAFCHAIAAAVLQSEQVQAWKRDAERYQCLRDHAEIGPGNVFHAWWLRNHGNPSTLDEALDIAIKEQP